MRRDLHRLRRRLFSVAFWRRKAVFGLGAALVGVAAAGFTLAADWAQELFATLRGENGIAAFLVTCAGFPLLSLATARWAPTARGSGIPQVIAARANPDIAVRLKLIGARTSLWKVASTILGLGFGASVGREGPTVQLGAGIMYVLGLGAGLRKPQGLVLAGAAAGIAAAFNTPLAGIMFAIEEMAKSYEKRISGLMIAAVVIAGAVSVTLLGNYKYFGSSEIKSGFAEAMGWAVICGLLCGFAGACFSWLMLRLASLIRDCAKLPSARVKLGFAIGFPLACGIIVALAGVLTDGYANGTGYAETRAALEGSAALPWYFGPAKLLATLASSLSGIPGGLFAPSLSVGAGLGSAISDFTGALDPSTVMLLATAAYFAAVVQSPLTAFVIVTEMTVSHQLLVPLLTAAFLGAGVSRLISREPLYHAMSKQF